MANRGSNSIFVLISIFFFIQLDVVLLQGPNGQGPGEDMYFDVSQENDFGIKIDVSNVTPTNNQIVVSIYSDSYTDSAQKFFTGQITGELLTAVSSCQAIKILFKPCTTSKIDQKSGNLSCAKGADQCTADEAITCVWGAIDNDEVQMGNFLECFFFNPKNIAECASKSKIDQARYKDCLSGASKSQDCDTFSNEFQGLIKTAADKKWPRGNAIDGFKPALCKLLKDNSPGCRTFCG